jgi:hypothetical protein
MKALRFQELRRWLYPMLLMAAASVLPGCRVVSGIFKAGLWVGVIAAVIVVALAVGVMRMLRRRH